jgi:biopolymer transport protein ExbB
MLQTIFQDLSGYIQAGGWVMPPLIMAAVVLWYAIGYRIAALRRGTRRGARNLVYRVRNGKKPKTDGVLVRAAVTGLKLFERGETELRAYLDEAFFEEESEIRKYRTLIITIVMVAPLMGLLGTVIGMIETFNSLGDMSLFSQSGGIAGGISQALFTTQMGLAVAIPGMIVSGILNRRQLDLELELAQIKDLLCSGEFADEGVD